MLLQKERVVGGGAGFNSFLTDDNRRSFYGQCSSRSDYREHAVWSLIYTVHIFIHVHLCDAQDRSSCNYGTRN